jgi:hypothetical protein
VSQWYSIEVFDGAEPASRWADAYGDALSESAIVSGATDWTWHYHTWGVVFEVCFDDESAWDAYTALAAVRAALDAVPDPVTGLIVYRGRGGSTGSRFPRRPRPLAGSGAAALPLPWDLAWEEPLSVLSLGDPPLLEITSH